MRVDIPDLNFAVWQTEEARDRPNAHHSLSQVCTGHE